MDKRRDCLPRLRFDCGIEDTLLEGNRALHRALVIRDISHTYAEFAGGHEWPYWQQLVLETLRFAGDV
jgi:enterochelin esterase-like enzyme